VSIVKSLYELLDVPRTAPADEIKRAFRREIARYHPDKVQHLGREFQEIAAAKAADLTQAYRTLTDPVARDEYDAQLKDGQQAEVSTPAASPAAPQPSPAVSEHAPRPAQEPQPTGAASVFAQDRAGADSLVRKATLARFRQAVSHELGRYEEPAVAGFEVAYVPKPGFWTLKAQPGVLGRFLTHVDAAAVAESWMLAAKMKTESQRDLCVFILGPSVAPAGELASAIAEQRRKPAPRGTKVVVIPVNTRTWNAHIPTDAPPLVKSLLTRLKAA
jgi:hypothetical protein